MIVREDTCKWEGKATCYGFIYLQNVYIVRKNNIYRRIQLVSLSDDPSSYATLDEALCILGVPELDSFAYKWCIGLCMRFSFIDT